MNVFNMVLGIRYRSAYYYRDAPFDFYSACSYGDDDKKAEVTNYIDILYSTFEHSGYCIGNYVNDMDKDLRVSIMVITISGY